MDSTTIYDGYNRLQAWLGSDRRMSTTIHYISDEDLNQLVQGLGYLDWADYKQAEAYAAEDLNAERGQY